MTTMITLFTPPDTDKSMEYLGNIFGSMSGVLPGENISILGTMFKTFNTTILAVAALVLVYTTVVGVMATAHEGEFMGKKWNNIWIPIRSVLGIVLMVPTTTGYSILQIVMMWVIVQGIGAADTLWNTATQYATTMGSVYAQGEIPTAGVTSSFRGLFSGLVCDASARMSRQDPTDSPGGGYYCASNSGGICGSTLTFNQNATSLDLGPDGACGSLSFCDQSAAGKCKDASSLDCLACRGVISGLAQVVPTLNAIAKNVVAADYSYREFYQKSALPSYNKGNAQWIYSYCSANNIPLANCCVKSSAPDSTCKVGATFPDPNTSKQTQNASSAAMKMYWKYYDALGPRLGVDTNVLDLASKLLKTSLDGIYSSYIATKAASDPNGSLSLGTSQQQGWITAGAYYWDLANLNQGNLQAAVPSITWTTPQDFSTGTMSNYRNNFQAASTLLSAASGGSNPLDDTTSAGMTAATAFSDSISQEGTNPLLAMQIVGSLLLIIAQIIITILAVMAIALGIVGFLDFYVLGTGFDNPLGPTAQFVMIFVLPAIYAIVGYLVMLGGILAVYIPLIPYVVFTFGAIGWLISVIEAMVAGPLVALGIISPSGHHELLGKAEPALMLLFNVFLRPSLMIFGLISAILLAYVVMKMINSLFWGVVFARVGLMGGLLSMAMIMGAYVMMVFAALNKTFSAINVIPQQVMRWISGQGEQVETPLDQIKGGVSKVGGETMSASKGAYSGAREGQKSAIERGSTVSKSDKEGKLSGENSGGKGT